MQHSIRQIPSQANFKPWFKEPMVWMVLMIPLSAVIVGMFMLTMSIRSYDGLVVDDYYKHGKEINRVLDRKQFAMSHDLKAEVAIGENQEVKVVLGHQDGFEKPEKIDFRLLHRTRAGRDQVVQLTQYGDGVYRGRFPEQVDGVWFAQLETEQWRIVGNVDLPVKQFYLAAR